MGCRTGGLVFSYLLLKNIAVSPDIFLRSFLFDISSIISFIEFISIAFFDPLQSELDLFG